MRRALAALALALPMALLAPPTPNAQLFGGGVRESLVLFILSQISSDDSVTVEADSVADAEDGGAELLGVRVSDPDGVFLTAEAMGLEWSASRLLLGELQIDRLTARGVRLDRAPNLPPAEPDPDAEAEAAEGFAWPRAPIDLRLDNLSLSDVRLAPGLAGPDPVAFDASGSATDEGDVQALVLSVTRTDAVRGALALAYSRDFAADTLSLSLDADEAAQGLVAALSGLPTTAPLRLALRADGALDALRTDMDLALGGVLTAQGGGLVQARAPLTVDLDLDAAPGPAAPEALALALGEGARLRVAAAEGADGLVEIAEAALRSPALTITAQGAARRDLTDIDAALALAADAPLAALIPGVAFDALRLDARATGALAALDVTGDVALDGLRADAADVAAAALTLRARLRDGAATATLQGDADGVRIDRLGPDLIGPARLRLVAATADGAVTLSEATLESALLRAQASGDAASDALALDYRVDAPDLARVAAAYGVEAAGALALEGRAAGTAAAPRVAGQARLSGLRAVGEDLGDVALDHDVTLGETIQGDARLRAAGSRFGPISADAAMALADGALRLESLAADALGVRLRGEAVTALDTLLTDGALDVDLVDLGPLSALVEADVAAEGALRLRLSADGGRQDATLDGALRGVSAPGAALVAMTLTAAVEDALGAAPALRAEAQIEEAALDAPLPPARVASLSATAEGRDLRAGAPLRLTARAQDVAAGDATLAALRFDGLLRDLFGVIGAEGAVEIDGLAAPGASVEALVATVDAAALTGEGDADLDATLTGLSVAGSRAAEATAQARWRPAEADGAATLSARLSPLRGGDVTLGAARLDASAAGALGDTPTVDAALEAEGAAAGPVRLSALSAAASGPLEALALALDARGSLEREGPQPLSLTARASLDAARDAPLLTAERFEARLADAALRLRRPMTAEFGAATLVRDLDLAAPGGTLRGAAALGPDALTAELALRLDDVAPLAALAGAPLEAGALTIDATVDAGTGRADARATATARRLRIAGVDPEVVRPDVDATARWDGRRASLQAAVSGFAATPARLTASTPLRAGPGGAPVLAAGTPIDARLSWRGRIEEFWAALPLPDHVLEGLAEIDLTASGPLDRLDAGGAATLREGRYQNLETGTILTALSADAAADASGALQVDARAEDGAGGPVTVAAAVDDGRLEARLTTSEATLVRRDDVTAVLSLDIAAAGPLAAPAISGDVVIDRAEVRLVSGGAPTLPDIGPVREAGAPPEPPAPQDDAGPITLDVAVRAANAIFVRGRGLDSEWRANLDVGGTADAPRISGSVDKIRGQLLIAGRLLDLDEGRVQFFGASPPDPAIAVALLRETDGVRGGVAVRGRASAPEIRFESTPALPEGEVLPRVLFDRSAQSLTPAQALQLASAVATLTDGSGGALDAVRATVGLDVLAIESDGEQADAVLGSRVADGVFVGARQPVDGGAASVTVEIEVFDDITLDSEVSPERGASVGINWRKDF